MSEQRKRLTDDEVLEKYGLVRLSDLRLPALRADHLQAREDRKRLAAALRGRIGGRCCEEARRQCDACAADEALLAEVDPQ